MAKENVYWTDAKYCVDGCTIFAGTFTTNNTSDPTAYTPCPMTITRTGVGRFKLAAREPCTRVLSVHASFEAATNGADRVVALAPSAGTSSANAYAEIQYQSAVGTAAESTGKVIHYIVVLQKSARKAR